MFYHIQFYMFYRIQFHMLFYIQSNKLIYKFAQHNLHRSESNKYRRM